MEDETEKIVNPGETIEAPVFSKIKAINFLDSDKKLVAKLNVAAIAIQAESDRGNDEIENKSVDEMWEIYMKQNDTTNILSDETV